MHASKILNKCKFKMYKLLLPQICVLASAAHNILKLEHFFYTTTKIIF